MKMKSNSKYISAVKTFSKKRILVIGDLMLDLYIEGSPRSISQEAPVLVVTTEKKYYKLGGAANAAENIRALGGKVLLAGVIGDQGNHQDLAGSFLHTLKKSKMDEAGIFVDHHRPTIVKMRIVSHGQQLLRVDEEHVKKISLQLENKIIRYATSALKQVDCVLFSDYQKGVLTKRLTSTIIKRAQAARKYVIIDPKPKNKSYYSGADYITPNEIELLKMYSTYDESEAKLTELARQLQRDLKIKNVLLTRGSKGMYLVTGNGLCKTIPSFADTVLDVSGAGDTVAAVIALTAGTLQPIEATTLAAYAAKISIGKRGTSTVTKQELMRQLTV
ncbi:MAG: PfkB family carbohydrate kinase [Patescibacteria group bacterium]